MDRAIRDLLEAVDDPIHDEEPPDLDWEGLCERIARLEPKLSRIAGVPFALDDEIQDATYIGDLQLNRRTGHGTELTFAVRFSNFGSLFTIWEPSDAEPMQANIVVQIVEAVSYAGFHYVPEDALATPYTGRNPTFKGATWWSRFFDYI